MLADVDDAELAFTHVADVLEPRKKLPSKLLRALSHGARSRY